MIKDTDEPFDSCSKGATLDAMLLMGMGGNAPADAEPEVTPSILAGIAEGGPMPPAAALQVPKPPVPAQPACT